MSKNKEQSIAMDFSEILNGLDGKWVVLSEDFKSVLKSFDSAEDIDDETASHGYIMRVPESNIVYVPIV